MRKLLGFVGATVGSYVGWWLGGPWGIMASFMLSMVGTGLGLWGGWKLAARWE